MSEWHDHHIGLFSLTPTEKEQSDEVLRDEIIKVGAAPVKSTMCVFLGLGLIER